LVGVVLCSGVVFGLCLFFFFFFYAYGVLRGSS